MGLAFITGRDALRVHHVAACRTSLLVRSEHKAPPCGVPGFIPAASVLRAALQGCSSAPCTDSVVNLAEAWNSPDHFGGQGGDGASSSSLSLSFAALFSTSSSDGQGTALAETLQAPDNTCGLWLASGASVPGSRISRRQPPRPETGSCSCALTSCFCVYLLTPSPAWRGAGQTLRYNWGRPSEGRRDELSPRT